MMICNTIKAIEPVREKSYLGHLWVQAVPEVHPVLFLQVFQQVQVVHLHRRLKYTMNKEHILNFSYLLIGYLTKMLFRHYMQRKKVDI